PGPPSRRRASATIGPTRPCAWRGSAPECLCSCGLFRLYRLQRDGDWRSIGPPLAEHDFLPEAPDESLRERLVAAVGSIAADRAVRGDRSQRSDLFDHEVLA